MNPRFIALAAALLLFLGVPQLLVVDGTDVTAQEKPVLVAQSDSNGPGLVERRTNFDATPRPVIPPTSLPGARGAPVGARDLTPGTPAVPCSDSRGCPDLFTVPIGPGGGFDWQVVNCTFTPSVPGGTCSPSIFGDYYNRYPSPNCVVPEGLAEYGPNLLLAFTFTAGNQGPGDLTIGNPYDHPEWFSFINCHGHPHFKEYADFRLWTAAGFQIWQTIRSANPGALSSDLLAAHPELIPYLTLSHKIGFCSIDTSRLLIKGVEQGPAHYTNCGVNQGISVSWADDYVMYLDGQWFDVTNVPNGNYVIETEVNAEHFFEETDYSNNFLNAPITLNVANRPPSRTPTGNVPSSSPTPSTAATATRTTTPTPTASSSPSATPSASRSPTAPSSTTGTPTPTVLAIGGRSLSLQAGPPRLSWLPGDAQDGYRIQRWSAASGTTTLLPAGSEPLSAATVDFTDTLPPGRSGSCYAVLPLLGSLVIGQSDMLCLVPDGASATGAPRNLALRLDQSRTARLSWEAPQAGGQNSYVLIAFRLDGAAPPALITLPGGATTTIHDTAGSEMCYILFAMAGGNALGNTDVLCGIPGFATVGGKA